MPEQPRSERTTQNRVITMFTDKAGFEHRTYQVFFLALYLRDNRGQFDNIKLPGEIEEHLRSITDEGIKRLTCIGSTTR